MENLKRRGGRSIDRADEVRVGVGSEARTNYRDVAVRKGARGPTLLYVFIYFGSIIVCRLHKLTLPDQTQATQQLKVSFSHLL
jgi:hypothetical protein